MLMRFLPIKRMAVLAATLMLAACGTLHKSPATLDEVSSESVLLVGRIEMRPQVDVKDEDIKLGTIDPFNMKDVYKNRAILYLSDTPVPAERTNDALNPRLEQTFFIRIPKDKPYLVHGTVYTSFIVTTITKRRMQTQSNEILLPAPIEFNIRPGDKAIYVGTWRFQRDEFNQVVKAEIIDQYPAALAELRKQFGAHAELRKALPRPQASSK